MSLQRSVAGLVPVLLVATAVVVRAPEARADDQLLRGRRLVVVDRPNSERFGFLSRGPVLVPLAGTGDDPTLVGATLDIENVSTGAMATFTLPAAQWSVNGNGTRYVFANSSAPGGGSAVRRAVLRSGGLLKISARDKGVAIDDPAPVDIRLVLSMGTFRYCALFDAGALRRYRPGRRLVARFAEPPSSCEETATTTSSSTTSSTSSTSTSSTTTSSLLPPLP